MTTTKSVRYPAYPLVVHDPYFSIWSKTDLLAGSDTMHWTGKTQALVALAWIDEQAFCLMGNVPEATPMLQKSVQVLPTRTIYVFEENGVRLTLTFLTPALPHKLNVLSRPATYIVFDAESLDGGGHEVAVYLSADGSITVNEPSEEVVWSRYRHPTLDLMGIGSAKQRVLERSGDDLRIDWGYLFLGVPREFKPETALFSNRKARRRFLETGRLPETDSLDFPEPARTEWICMATTISFQVEPGRTGSAYAILAYNDLYSVEYMNRRLAGYWKLETESFGDLLTLVCRDYKALRQECEQFDEELLADATLAGGGKYAGLCAGAFRQTIGAHKLVADAEGVPLFFSKENFSNGCIATVDVTYPSSPLFLLCQPELVKGMLIPILEYASSSHWKHPFAPHDLGTYPLANGQVYRLGEEGIEKNQMPVEECGNLLILATALARFHGEVDFVRKYWGKFRQWAEYLLEHGYDPADQLCSDDFAGHLAHNTNLSLKAIIALEGFGIMAGLVGEKELAEKYSSVAQEYAQRWVQDADDGGWFRLAFDQVGSWSQKYNLVWDRILELGLFPASVVRKELDHYRRVQNPYGLPLDNRRTYTKLDWILWTATLAEGDEDFQALFDPVYRWMEETPSRVPMTDWFETVGEGQQVRFQARSVVGGVFIKMLANQSIRQKWISKVQEPASGSSVLPE